MPACRCQHWRCVEETIADLQDSGLVAPVFGHIGDGNFHCMLPIYRDDPKELQHAEALSMRLVRRATALDGTCTGAHGVGLRKQQADPLRPPMGEPMSCFEGGTVESPRCPGRVRPNPPVPRSSWRSPDRRPRSTRLIRKAHVWRWQAAQVLCEQQPALAGGLQVDGVAGTAVQPLLAQHERILQQPETLARPAALEAAADDDVQLPRVEPALQIDNAGLEKQQACLGVLPRGGIEQKPHTPGAGQGRESDPQLGACRGRQLSGLGLQRFNGAQGFGDPGQQARPGD